MLFPIAVALFALISNHCLESKAAQEVEVPEYSVPFLGSALPTDTLYFYEEIDSVSVVP